MGYTTTFQGKLKFTKEMTSSELAYLKKFLEKDAREIDREGNPLPKETLYTEKEHPDSFYQECGFRHIDYKLSDDFSGIEWNGAEKSYDMVEIAQYLINIMKKKYPDFGLKGEMSAQGEDPRDIWILKVKDNVVEKIEIETDEKDFCPHCGEKISENAKD